MEGGHSIQGGHNMEGGHGTEGRTWYGGGTQYGGDMVWTAYTVWRGHSKVRDTVWRGDMGHGTVWRGGHSMEGCRVVRRPCEVTWPVQRSSGDQEKEYLPVASVENCCPPTTSESTKTGCNGGVWESAGNKPTEEILRATATTAHDGRVVGGGLPPSDGRRFIDLHALAC